MRLLIIFCSLALSGGMACDSKPADGGESHESEGVEQDTATEESTQPRRTAPPEEEARSDVNEKAPADRRIAISLELDEDQLHAAEELTEALAGPTFPSREVKVDNVPLFLHLAASSEDSTVVNASLAALERLYRPQELVDEERHIAVDDDYRTLILAHLDSEVDPVLGNAIRGASHVINHQDSLDEETASKLAALVKDPRPEVAYDALSALERVKGWTENADLVDAFVAAIGHSEPYVASRALIRLQGSTERGDSDAADLLWEVVMDATEHADPGVRGRAISLLSHLSSPGDDADEIDEDRIENVGALAVKMLEDEHPYTISSAAGAISQLNYTEGIPALMELVDDHRHAGHLLRGWTKLNGNRGRLHHGGGPESRVSDSVLASLSGIRLSDRALEFDYTRLTPMESDIEEYLQEHAERARTWFEENEEALY